MLVTNPVFSSDTKRQENQLRFKQGEIYRGSIIKKHQGHEATLSIRGKHVRAIFDGKVPSSGSLADVEVQGTDGDKVKVRSIESSPSQQVSSTRDMNSSRQLLQRLGMGNHHRSSLVEATQFMLQRGAPITKESVGNVQQFLNEGNGTEEGRLQTVKTVVSKGIQPTSTNLQAVNETLHGESLHKSVQAIHPSTGSQRQTLASGSDQAKTSSAGDDTVQKAVKQFQTQNQSLMETVKKYQAELTTSDSVKETIARIRRDVSGHPEMPAKVSAELEEAMKKAEKLVGQGQKSEAREQVQQALKKTEESLQRQPNQRSATSQTGHGLKEVVTTAREALHSGEPLDKTLQNIEREILRHPNIDKETARRLEKSIDEARHLQHVGKERVDEALKKVEQKLDPKPESPTATLKEDLQRLRQAVEGNPRLERAVDQLQKQVDSSRPLPDKVVNDIQKAVQDVRQRLHSSSHEQTARVIETVQQLERQVASIKGETLHPHKPNIERFSEQVRQYLQQIGADQAAADRVITLAKQSVQLDQVARQRVGESLQSLQTAMNQQGVPSESSPSLQQNVEMLQKELRTEPDTSQLIDKVRKLAADHPQIQQDVDQSAEKLEEGKELASRQQLAETVQRLEQQAQPHIQPTERSSTYVQNEQIQTTVPFESKQLLETRITEKLAQVASEFKDIKRDVSRQLDQTSRLLEQYKQQSAPQAKQILESTIKKLDRAILRSEMMLFTDMKTEKRLLEASGQLREAMSFLSKGKIGKAQHIVQQVQTLMEKLEFNPSEQKVRHLFFQDGKTSSKQPQPFIPTPNPSGEASARQTFEMLRSLGLNRESEIGQALAAGKKPQDASLKTSLMTFMQGEEDGSPLKKTASQAVQNITGQQLLSKPDPAATAQQMMFQLPFQMKEQLENLQVYINAREQGEQLDWENCSLYFLIETPKLGEVGIHVQTQDRQLSVTLKNDQNDFAEKMAPFVDETTESLADIGYSIQNISYQPMKAKEEGQAEEQAEEEEWLPIFNEKGFDFKI